MLSKAKHARSLNVKTIIYALSVAIDRSLGLLLLPALTRLLSPGDYGAWTQTGVAAGLLVAAVLYAFPTVLVRHYVADIGPVAHKRAFLRIGLLCLGLWSGFCFLVFIASGGAAEIIYGNIEFSRLLPALLVWVLAEAIVEFAIAWWRTLGLITAIAGVVVSRSVIRVSLALLLATYSGQPLSGWLFYYSLASSVFALMLLGLCWRSLHNQVENINPVAAPSMRELLLEATPLVVLSLLTVLSSSVDRYILTAWVGLDGVGSYAAASSIAAIPFMFHSVLGFTLFPVMARHWAQGQRADAMRWMNQSLLLYLFLSLPLVLTIAVFGQDVLRLLATSRYYVDPAVFVGLSLSVLALGVQQVLVYGLLLDGRSVQVLRLATLAGAVNAILAFVLVPRFAASGAATAVALANLSLVIMTIRALRLGLVWNIPWNRVGRIVTHALMSFLPMSLLLLMGFSSVFWILPVLIAAGGFYLVLDWYSGQSSLLRELFIS